MDQLTATPESAEVSSNSSSPQEAAVSQPTSAPTEKPSTAASIEAIKNAPQNASTTEHLSTQTPAPVPTYQPSYKFMVKGKEQEIPEAFRQIIKDQESEKQVKEMFEKAYGLEHVKADRSKVSEDFRSYKSQAEPIMQIAKQLDHFYSKGDLTSYFKTLGIRKEEVFNWAVQQAEIENLPENQKAVYHQQQESEARAYQLEQQLQQREMEYQQFKVQHRENELNTVLSTPEISQAVQAFNQRNGEGAFWNEVVARGQWYWHAQGRDVPATEIVNELMTKYGLNQPAPVAHQAMQAQTQQMNQPGTQSSPKQVPVIPNTGPGSASPAQRAVKSTADLQKIYAEKYGPR